MGTFPGSQLVGISITGVGEVVSSPPDGVGEDGEMGAGVVVPGVGVVASATTRQLSTKTTGGTDGN